MTTRVRKFIKMWLLILLAFAGIGALAWLFVEAVTHNLWWVLPVAGFLLLSGLTAWELSK